jgi:hypothetical protein
MITTKAEFVLKANEAETKNTIRMMNLLYGKSAIKRGERDLIHSLLESHLELLRALNLK